MTMESRCLPLFGLQIKNENKYFSFFSRREMIVRRDALLACLPLRVLNATRFPRTNNLSPAMTARTQLEPAVPVRRCLFIFPFLPPPPPHPPNRNDNHFSFRRCFTPKRNFLGKKKTKIGATK